MPLKKNKITMRVLKYYRIDHLSMCHNSECTVLLCPNSADKGANVTYKQTHFLKPNLTNTHLKIFHFRERGKMVEE